MKLTGITTTVIAFARLIMASAQRAKCLYQGEKPVYRLFPGSKIAERDNQVVLDIEIDDQSSREHLIAICDYLEIFKWQVSPEILIKWLGDASGFVKDAYDIIGSVRRDDLLPARDHLDRVTAWIVSVQKVLGTYATYREPFGLSAMSPVEIRTATAASSAVEEKKTQPQKVNVVSFETAVLQNVRRAKDIVDHLLIRDADESAREALVAHLAEIDKLVQEHIKSGIDTLAVQSSSAPTIDMIAVENILASSEGKAAKIQTDVENLVSRFVLDNLKDEVRELRQLLSAMRATLNLKKK